MRADPGRAHEALTVIRAALPVIAVALTVSILVGCAAAGGSASVPTPSPAASSTTTPTATRAIPSATPRSTPSEAPEVTPMPSLPFTLSSPAFAEGGAIPSRYGCDGAGVSPPLAWSGAPGEVRTLALVVTDPDARGFVHWVALGIDPASGGLDEGVSGSGAFQEGRNDFGRTGYGGPCPPSGTHHYVFRLLGLDADPSISGVPTAADLLGAAAGHVVGEATLTGTYRRGG